MSNYNTVNNRTLLAALIGGLVSFLLSFLLRGTLLAAFYRENAGTAAGIMKTPPDTLAVLAGHLIIGLLYALLFSGWAGISTARTGAIRGGWIGFLVFLSHNLILFGNSKYLNMSAVLVDSIVGGIMGAVVGAVVGSVLGGMPNLSGRGRKSK